MEDESSYNPFRDLTEDELKRYLEDLGDTELLDLLDTVSADLKRRNNLLPRPGEPGTGPDTVKNVVDTLFKASGRG